MLKVDFQFKGWNFAIVPGAVLRWRPETPGQVILSSGYDEDWLQEMFWTFARDEMQQMLDERRKAVAEKWLVRHFSGTFSRDDVQRIVSNALKRTMVLVEQTARQTENLDVIPGRKVETE